MANKRLQREEQYHSKNSLLEMYRFHAKIRLKSASQKLNLAIAKAVSKVTYKIVAANTLARSRIVTHSSTASFLIKITLCESNSIFF